MARVVRGFHLATSSQRLDGASVFLPATRIGPEIRLGRLKEARACATNTVVQETNQERLVLALVIVVGVHAMLALSLWGWARWVAKRQCGGAWKRVAWLPMAGLAFGVAGAAAEEAFGCTAISQPRRPTLSAGPPFYLRTSQER